MRVGGLDNRQEVPSGRALFGLVFRDCFSQCLKHTRYAKSVYGKELLSAVVDLPASVSLRQWRWMESVVTSLQWAAVTQLLR